MKVVLPVAGVGARMRPLTLNAPKCLLPIAGGSILGHILKKLEGLPITEYIFVVGYLGDAVEEYVHREFSDLPSRFVRQSNQQGLGEAIYLCKDFFGNEPLLIILGDTLFEADFSQLNNLQTNILYTREVADPKRFGVAKTDKNGTVEFLVEKPAEFVSNQALVGIYAITNAAELSQALGELISNNRRTRGEFQLTDALESMLKSGCVFKTAGIDEWLDCGTPEILLESNKYLLKNSDPHYSVGEGSEIVNCEIGNFVSIGKNCKLQNVKIENSIVSDECEISNSKICKSILCENARINDFEGSVYLGNYSAVRGVSQIVP
ncbi:glucose-1-phosphate thymidylyltransferase [Fibrobacterales bacterium]|nr:glucose-1-phosphate thymidylyltransferase [Fibrobacterales bacterium]